MDLDRRMGFDHDGFAGALKIAKDFGCFAFPAFGLISVDCTTLGAVL